MADLKYFRKQAVFPDPSGHNNGAARYDTTREALVYSDGTEWKLMGTRSVQKQVITFRAAAAADQVSQTIFIAQGPVTVVGAYEVHATESSVAADLLYLWKTTSTDLPGTGTALTSFALDGTANTVLTGTLTTEVASGAESVLKLAAGDRLSVSFSGTLTSLAGVQVTVIVESEVVSAVSGSPVHIMALNPLNGDNVSQTVFVAPMPCLLVGVSEVHKTAGTHGSAVTVTVKKNGISGTALTDALSLKTTANTVQTAVLSTVAGALELNTGDYLTLTFAGTTTSLAGVAVSLWLTPISTQGVSFITANQGAVADMVDEALFIAPGPTQLVYAAEAHGTATTSDCGAVLVKDTGTDAPGAGTDILTNSTTYSTGFNMNATALTPQYGAWATTRSLVSLGLGNRLSVDYDAATTGGAKACITVAAIIM